MWKKNGGFSSVSTPVHGYISWSRAKDIDRLGDHWD